MNQPNIRVLILDAITANARQYGGNLQSNAVLSAACAALGQVGRTEAGQQAILTAFHDLFRTGYLAWGMNLSNPDPPFFHMTDQGRRSLREVSRDPSNPDGYLEHLRLSAPLTPIPLSYITEATQCFVADLPKATAVMIGAAAESLVLELRDLVVTRLGALGRQVPNRLRDWRAKTVLDAVYAFLESNKAAMPNPLWESVDGYWSAFLQQIRSARNDAGHPSRIDPVTIDTVHASLLIFPELAKLASRVRDWVSTGYA